MTTMQPTRQLPENAARLVISDEEVWYAFQEGEDAAFTMLYSRYADRLYAYLKLLLTSRPGQLDDLFQETWIVVFEQRTKFVPRGTHPERKEGGAHGSFAGWLFRVAHNIAIGVLRKTSHTTSIEDLTIDSELIEGFIVDPVHSEGFEGPTTDELMLHVVQAVESLPLMLREVFVLSEFDRLDLDQISDTLGITRTNAKVRLFRARRALREQLGSLLSRKGYQ